MLKQILRDMYVDPEILAELPEEQKQILFFKIREEQIRRYMEIEKRYEKKGFKRQADKKKESAKMTAKKVRILEDSNSQPWTWVMGEHPNDTPVEEIWENLGNENWKPTKRSENQQPVSKVQAIIFAQNKQNKKPNGLSSPHGTLPSSDAIESSKAPIPNEKVVGMPEQKTKPNPPATKPKPPQSTRTEGSAMQKPASDKGPKKATNSLPPSVTPSPPATPPKPASRTKVSTASDPSNNAPKSSSNVPPLAKKPIVVRKTPSNKRDTDDSDDDPYENMKELADALPSRELGENEWKTQLRRYKAADERRRSHAKRASVLIKRQSQQNVMREQKLMDLKTKFERKRSSRELVHPRNRPSLPPKPTNLRPKHPAPKEGREAKPNSREEVEQWFKETQSSEILASADDNNTLPKWFHGIIPRSEAESLLEERNAGDFLIRVSDKIWGYALSYKDENKIKHFLIDASEANCYHFFGNDQIRHPGLEQLIAFHQDEPLSYGNEILRNVVGQKDPAKPDYDGLIEDIATDARINKDTHDTAF